MSNPMSRGDIEKYVNQEGRTNAGQYLNRDTAQWLPVGRGKPTLELVACGQGYLNVVTGPVGKIGFIAMEDGTPRFAVERGKDGIRITEDRDLAKPAPSAGFWTALAIVPEKSILIASVHDQASFSSPRNLSEAEIKADGQAYAEVHGRKVYATASENSEVHVYGSGGRGEIATFDKATADVEGEFSELSIDHKGPRSRVFLYAHTTSPISLRSQGLISLGHIVDENHKPRQTGRLGPPSL